MKFQPNPYEERLHQIIEHSRSLNPEAGDLVQLNKEQVVPYHRQGREKEPFNYMIAGYTSLSSSFQEFVVLSCTSVARFRDCIERIIEKGHTNPHPCHQFPCALSAPPIKEEV